jgi:hypothetical protein
LTEEEYKKEVELYSIDFQYSTTINYSDFLNDFDFENFDSFFENVILQLCLECQISIEKLISNSNKIKAKISLQDILRLIINSNNFLENFRSQNYTNNIQKYICGYLIYFNNLLLAEIKNTFKLIFPRIINNIPNEINIVRENMILEDVLSACYSMQENKTYIEDRDENKRTKQVLDLLKIKYTVYDQSQKGTSSTGKKPGSVDGIIIDKDLNEYYIEALNLICIDTTNITEHINKLEFNYDYKGLYVKFVLIYFNVGEEKFYEFSEKYKKFIDIDLVSKYTKIGSSEEVLKKHTNTRIFKSYHLRENQNVCLYHILLKFPL